jgi:hypothetical protein
MGKKLIIAAGLFAALNLCTLSARAEVEAATHVAPRHLDIKQVVAFEESSAQFCDVVEARMTYLDSQDKTQVLKYRKVSSSCSDGS